MDSNCRTKAFLSLTALLICGLELGYLLAASKPPVRARQGMVASSEKLASQIGIDTLKKGGNAVDAAVAVGFALAVTHPSAGNLGGGGFMMIRLATGETACIDYREMAPAAADRDVYLDSAGQIIPKASTQGYRASGVPGTPAGLCLALKKYGRLSLKEAIQPAIDLAEQGFPVSDHLSDSLKAAGPRLELFAESRRVYLKDGKYFRAGRNARPERSRQDSQSHSRQRSRRFLSWGGGCEDRCRLRATRPLDDSRGPAEVRTQAADAVAGQLSRL